MRALRGRKTRRPDTVDPVTVGLRAGTRGYR